MRRSSTGVVLRALLTTIALDGASVDGSDADEGFRRLLRRKPDLCRSLDGEGDGRFREAGLESRSGLHQLRKHHGSVIDRIIKERFVEKLYK